MASPYLTVLEIVNEVCDRMNVRRVTATTSNLFTRNCVNLINDTIVDLTDFGTWNELQASAVFTLVSGEAIYSIPTSTLATAKHYIHSVQEVHVSGRVPALEPIDTTRP